MRMNKKCQGGGGQLAANSIQMPFNSLILHGFGGHFYRQYSLLVCNTKIKPGRALCVMSYLELPYWRVET